MFLVRGQKAKLVQYNRNGRSLAYDDEDKNTIDIEVIPYNVDDEVSFGTYTEPNAVGSFIVRRQVDVKEGDEIIWNNRTYSIVRLADKWIYNRIEYKVAHVK
jgi:hypothetical protein